MSAETRYFRVGLFLLGGIALLVVAILALGGGRMFRGKVLFETYFDETVQGLEVGSPVKLRGVKLGSVSDILLVEDAYPLPTLEDRFEHGQKVLVRMELVPRRAGGGGIGSGTNLQAAIDEGLRLRLSSQPVTGIAFIEADFLDPDENPPMEITWEPRTLYVPSAPSRFKVLSTAAERIFSRIEAIDVEGVILHLDGLLASATRAVDTLDAGRVEGETLALIAELRGTNARLQRILDGGKYDLDVALENLRVASENLRDLSETARSYPSLMILGEPPPPSERLGR